MDTNQPAAAALPDALAQRLATPTVAVLTIEERLESLLQGYALEIGSRALAGDTAGMERSQRFHRQVTQLRDHWTNGNASPVRAPKQAAAKAVA